MRAPTSIAADPRQTSWNVFASIRPDDFVTATQWLRGRPLLLGESFFGDRLVWFEHSSAGYASFALPTRDQSRRRPFQPPELEQYNARHRLLSARS